VVGTGAKHLDERHGGRRRPIQQANLRAAGQAANCTVANDAASYNLADFMFGLPSQIQLANWLVGNYRQRDYYFYLQDDFRVNSKLTLNLGLRWEYASPRWERDNVLSNYDPVSNSMITAKSGGVYERTLINPDYRDWAPRIGLAYSFNPKTVFRGGYGISYERNFGNVTFNIIQNPPNYAVVSLTAGTDVPTITLTADNSGPLAGPCGCPETDLPCPRNAGDSMQNRMLLFRPPTME
jgi:outer membrane receptor protein involved in Fe transport